MLRTVIRHVLRSQLTLRCYASDSIRVHLLRRRFPWPPLVRIGKAISGSRSSRRQGHRCTNQGAAECKQSVAELHGRPSWRLLEDNTQRLAERQRGAMQALLPCWVRNNRYSSSAHCPLSPTTDIPWYTDRSMKRGEF